MNPVTGTQGIGRRSILFFLAGCLGWLNSANSAKASSAKAKLIAASAKFVDPKLRWTPNHLYNFLNSLPPEARLDLKRSLELLPSSATARSLQTSAQDADDIQKKVLWLSSNILAYPFKKAKNLDYHKLVSWVATEAGVSKQVVRVASTFDIERDFYRIIFAQLWDKMTREQREELLKKVDPNGHIADKAAIAALGSAGALAVLSTTVAFTGFAFYSTMSIAIASLAAAAGVTWPMATYVGASALVGILAGPVGWAIMSLAFVGGIALLGRANLQKTTTFVAQIHAFKIEALAAASVSENIVFQKRP